MNSPMASDRVFELDDLLVRPGTYFNPQTEVMVVVDDSQAMDQEIFNLEEFEGADWVLVSDEAPVDDARRDELFETFQARHHGGDGRQAVTADDDVDLDAGSDDEEDAPPPPAEDPDEA